MKSFNKSMLTMKSEMYKNHQATEEVSGSRSGPELFFGNFVGNKMSSAGTCHAQGASGIVTESPNCSRSPGVTPPVMMDCNILMGLSRCSLAVLMMVMASSTFFLPCAVRLPKVIFRKRTLLRIPVSALLFVGSITGYLRKTKSSFLWVISSLRMLSASWCDNGECWYSILNLLRIAFLPERYSSAVRMEY